MSGDPLSWEMEGLGGGKPDHMKRSGWVAVGLNTYRKVNTTSTLGATQGIYDGLLFGLGNREYKVMKVKEDFHVTPHTQNPFYQNAKAQRGELERIISTTLTDIGNEVGQWQLLQHDVRKAEEMLNYYTSDDTAALKTIFVDQVDYYTGGGGGQGEGRLSMAFMRKSNIMPTIVEDFLSMADLEDLAEGGSLGKLPQVEKNFLKAKWAAYTQWKNLFKEGIDERYRTVKTLCDTKERYLDERREWLKPHVMQHKMLNNSLSSEGGRAGVNNSFFDRPGEARSFTNQTVWMWKPLRTRHNIDRVPDEMYKNPRYVGKNGEIEAYDYHIQEEYLYKEKNKDGGNLILGKYPWITEKQIEKYVSGLTHMTDAQHKFDHHGQLDEAEWYYTVWTIDYEKTIFNVIKDGQPTPIEDGMWTIHGYIVTKNMLLLKLLERKCEDEKIEIEMRNIINMDKDKYSLKYHCTKEFGSYVMTKDNMVYAHKDRILKGKDFKKHADDDGKVDVDGKKYTEEDFILFSEDDLKKLKDDEEKTGGLSFDKVGNLIIPGSYYKAARKTRDAALDVIKNVVQKKLLKFNDYSDVLLQRVSKPEKKEVPFVKTTKEFFKNFGVDLKFTVEKGPYQSEMLDALTQGTFKLAGSTFWGPEIIGPLYKNINIPW
ncbi:MAG: hypothetical protein KAI18_00870 [Candidatus Aenigmarchaeota archaeon]|nr:hypothetical protein [Candidatus Aenigmarchaeota archaeon]